MADRLDPDSTRKLEMLHGDLRRVVFRALLTSAQPFAVLEGVSPDADSRHAVQESTGGGHAIDLIPVPLDWDNLDAFDAIAEAMQKAADELATPIRYGGDYDADGKPLKVRRRGSPHFELVR